MANYDSMYGEGITDLFSEELINYVNTTLIQDDFVLIQDAEERKRKNDELKSMKARLIQSFEILNRRYTAFSLYIEDDLDACRKFWNFYKFGITLLAKFMGYIQVKNNTREELAFYLVDFWADGKVEDPEWIKKTFTNMVIVKGDLDRMSY